MTDTRAVPAGPSSGLARVVLVVDALGAATGLGLLLLLATASATAALFWSGAVAAPFLMSAGLVLAGGRAGGGRGGLLVGLGAALTLAALLLAVVQLLGG